MDRISKYNLQDENIDGISESFYLGDCLECCGCFDNCCCPCCNWTNDECLCFCFDCCDGCCS